MIVIIIIFTLILVLARAVVLSQRIYKKQTSGAFKNIKLSASEIKRLQKVIYNAIVSRQPKCEFKYYARLLKNIGTPEFREKLHSLPVPTIQYLQERKECCLQEVYWRNKQ